LSSTPTGAPMNLHLVLFLAKTAALIGAVLP
jgi:hypothetical protein